MYEQELLRVFSQVADVYDIHVRLHRDSTLTKTPLQEMVPEGDGSVSRNFKIRTRIREEGRLQMEWFHAGKRPVHGHSCRPEALRLVVGVHINGVMGNNAQRGKHQRENEPHDVDYVQQDHGVNQF